MRHLRGLYVLRPPYRIGCTSPIRPQAIFHIERRHQSNSTTSPQPNFPGFVLDTLDAPLHSIISRTRSTPTPPPADELPKTEEEAKLAKARVVFGSRLAGPVEREKAKENASQNIAGVLVPPRPEEPDNCCMSGCVNCVWDLYRDDMEEWAAKSAEARAKLTAQRKEQGNMKGGMPGHVASSMDEDGGGTGLAMDGFGEDGAGADLFEGIPVGIREFMKTEKKLKERHRLENTRGG